MYKPKEKSAKELDEAVQHIVVDGMSQTACALLGEVTEWRQTKEARERRAAMNRQRELAHSKSKRERTSKKRTNHTP